MNTKSNLVVAITSLCFACLLVVSTGCSDMAPDPDSTDKNIPEATTD